MKQKTCYFDKWHDPRYKFYDDNAGFKVGDEVILVCNTYEDGSEIWRIVPHTGKGIPGNMDKEKCCYHGWRGTSCGKTIDAYGVRKIIKICEDSRNPDIIKVTVGKDLHPDWE